MNHSLKVIIIVRKYSCWCIMNDYLFRYYALLLNSVLLITTSCYCCIMMMTCKVIGPSQIHTHPSIFGSPLPGSPHFVAIVAVLRLRAHFDLIDLHADGVRAVWGGHSGVRHLFRTQHRWLEGRAAGACSDYYTHIWLMMCMWDMTDDLCMRHDSRLGFWKSDIPYGSMFIILRITQHNHDYLPIILLNNDSISWYSCLSSAWTFIIRIIV